MKNSEEKKVNLFVVGAMKAGTTTFMEQLSRHKDIYASPVKEPHFFVDELPKKIYEPSRFFSLEAYLENSYPEPLHITKIKTLEQYAKIFSTHKNQKYLAEASTAYLTTKETPKLIHGYNSNASIIVLTRDPLKRCFSHYTMMVGLSRENKSFEEVITEELDLHKRGELSAYSYIGMSLYEKNIERYKKHFKNVLVIKFEDLIKNPVACYKNVTQFLEIDSFESINLQETNKTRSLKFEKLFYVLKRVGLKDVFSLIFSSKIKKRIFKLASKERKNEMMLPSALKDELLEVFSQENS